MLLLSLFGVSVLPFMASGCGGGSTVVQNPLIIGEGTVVQTYDIGMLLETTDITYKIQSLPPEFRQGGLRVSFQGREVGTFTDPYGGTVYPVIQLTQISKL